MANKTTGLDGPFELTSRGVNNAVTEISAGTYALGHMKSNGRTFVVEYIGRSDEDLNGRLQTWVGEGTDYTHFKAKYHSSALAAYEKECDLYHDWGTGGDNEIHPARPEGYRGSCHRC